MKTAISFVIACVTAGSLLAQSTFTKITTGAIVTDGGSSYGCAWGDFDNDGFINLAVANAWGQNNFLYRNTGTGAFTRILTGPFVTDGLDTIGVIWGDYDNDGFLDLFATTFDPPRTDALYHNNGDGTFTQITSGPQSNDSGAGTSAAWVDYDRDGWLDLFVDNSLNQNELLYHNNANGTFTQITSGPLVNSGQSSFGPAWGDYDNDGDPDVFVANGGLAPGENDFLFRNDGGGAFTRISSGPVVTDAAQSNDAGWADYDNDGDLDLMVTIWNHRNDRLYENLGDGTFRLVQNSVVTTDGLSGLCLAWGDYDNDGWIDLFVGNNQGDLNRLYRNRGDGSFEVVLGSPLSTEGSGRSSAGCAWGDYDNDGFLDLFVANCGPDPDVFGESDNFLYHNDGNTNGWLLVKLIGGTSNRSAIGAKVRVRATIGGRLIDQLREVSGDGQVELRAHFGLGDAAKADTVRIEWPSGFVQELRDVAARQILRVVEPEDLAIRSQPRSTNALPGATATLRVTAVSPLPITYQWQFNGTNLPGATNAALTITNAQLDPHTGFYRVLVSNTASNLWSDTATLIVLVRPTVTSQPVAQTVLQGGTAVFSVSAIPDHHPLLPLNYRWTRQAVTFLSNAPPTLVITNAQPGADGLFRAVITNLAGFVNSALVSLTVLPDFDRDGMADAWEMLHGFDTNNLADAGLDFDGDGMINRDEYAAGTSPTNAASVLRMQLAPQAGGEYALTFLAISNRTYRVEWNTQLTGDTWSNLLDVLAQPADRIESVTDTNAGSAMRFYRVVTPRRP